MKDLITILTVLLDNTAQYLNPEMGLCDVADTLLTKEHITIDERIILFEYMRTHLPKRTVLGKLTGAAIFCWEQGDLEPRIKWCNEQLDLLTNPKT